MTLATALTEAMLIRRALLQLPVWQNCSAQLTARLKSASQSAINAIRPIAQHNYQLHAAAWYTTATTYTAVENLGHLSTAGSHAHASSCFAYNHWMQRGKLAALAFSLCTPASQPLQHLPYVASGYHTHALASDALRTHTLLSSSSSNIRNSLCTSVTAQSLYKPQTLLPRITCDASPVSLYATSTNTSSRTSSSSTGSSSSSTSSSSSQQGSSTQQHQIPPAGPAPHKLRAIPFLVSRAEAEAAFAAYHQGGWLRSRQAPQITKSKEAFLPFWMGSATVQVYVKSAQVGVDRLVSRWEGRKVLIERCLVWCVRREHIHTHQQ